MEYENLPFESITLRAYSNITDTDSRELIKKLALSLGLISQNDARDVIADCMYVLIINSKKQQWISSKQIYLDVSMMRKSLSLSPTVESNIRRVLKQLKDFGLIERVKAKYRIVDFKDLDLLVEDIIKKKVEKITQRVIICAKKI